MPSRIVEQAIKHAHQTPDIAHNRSNDGISSSDQKIIKKDDAGKSRAPIKQAHDDLKKGLQDTDLRNQPAYETSSPKSRNPK